MSARTRWIKRRALALAVAAISVVAIAGTAVAGHQTSGVKSYTGCLVSGDGVMIKIKEGNAPRSACTGGQVEAHFSGGDITSITAQSGGGLSGGGENGAVSLSIRRDCGNGQVVKWNGSAWACADDSNSTYTAGTGLDLASSGEFSVEEGYRLPQNCASGEAATRNPAVGGGAATWTCDQYATADQACTSGQFATGITGVGALSCAAAGGGALPFFEATAGVAGIPDDGVSRTYLTLELPAGRYILVSAGTLASEGNFDSDSVARCASSLGGGRVDVTSAAAETLGLSWDELDLVKTTGAPITVGCVADEGADGASIRFPTLQAVKVG